MATSQPAIPLILTTSRRTRRLRRGCLTCATSTMARSSPRAPSRRALMPHCTWLIDSAVALRHSTSHGNSDIRTPPRSTIRASNRPGNLRRAMALFTGFEVREQVGVPLYDGVSEFGLAGLIDLEVGSMSANSFLMAPERSIVRGATGFLFVPRFTFSTVPALDRVLIPAGEHNVSRQQVVAAWGSARSGPAVEDIYQDVGPGESAYDATLQDLARTRHGALAQTIASSVFYRKSSPQRPGRFTTCLPRPRSCSSEQAWSSAQHI